MSLTRRLFILAWLAVFLLEALLFATQPVFTVETTETSILECEYEDGYISDADPLTYADARNSTTGTVTNTTTYSFLGQEEDTGAFFVWRTFLFFDTSTLPADANITSAILSLYVETDESDVDFNVTIQNGQPTYPHDPLEEGDYYYTHYSGNGGNRSTSTISGVGYWNITLTDDGEGWISLSSTTRLCLRSSEDIAYSAPTGNEYIVISTTEEGTSETPLLYITYTTDSYLYRLYGAYDEDGQRDGVINCTFYRPTQSNIEFELDGEHNVTSEEDTRMVFIFDLGYNESRIFYVGDQQYMDIYVFTAVNPETYYFSVVDMVGMTNGYLETLVVVNGTDRIVERQRLDILNDIPFTLSTHRAYKVRVVCDEGSYTFGRFIAHDTYSYTFVVTSDLFPSLTTHLGNLTIFTNRTSGSTILLNYTDSWTGTTWINFSIYDFADDSQDYTSNQTASSYNFSWTGANSATDYYGILESYYDDSTVSWRFSYPEPSTSTNPWDLDWLDPSGSFPFPLSQLFAFVLIALVFAAGNRANAHVTIAISLVVAAFFVWFGWLTITPSWFAVSFGVGILAAISFARERREKRMSQA